MAKTCPKCSTDNRDDAQFCNTCGTSLAVRVAAAPVGEPCRDCGHLNVPGTRYCGSCGLSLLGSVVVPRPRPGASGAPGGPDSTGGYFLHSASAPFGAPSTQHGDDYDTLPPAPQIPAATAAPAPSATTPPAPTAQPTWVSDPIEADARRSPMVWVSIALAVVALGAGAWWLMGSDGAETQAHAPTPPVTTPEPAPPPPPAVAPAVQPAPAAPAAAAPIEPPPATPAPPPAPPPSATPAAAPTAATPDAPATPAPTDAQRVAREKAAKARADAEAKAKALAQQREAEAAARAKAEQDATARRSAEAPKPAPAAPAAPSPSPAPTPAVAAAPVQTAEAICADRSILTRPLCESRECAKPEHKNEALCRQIREREEKRQAAGQ